MIRKKGGKYCVYSRKSGRNLGCSRTKAGARQREREVQYFKHNKRRDVRVRPHRRTVATHMITRETPRSGVLVPPRQRKSRGKIFAVDEVVGDDKYIFLSVEDIFSGGRESVTLPVPSHPIRKTNQPRHAKLIEIGVQTVARRARLLCIGARIPGIGRFRRTQSQDRFERI